MIKNYSALEIKENKRLSDKFLNADFKKINLKCNLYNGNFYLDSFNYFLIDDEFSAFDHLYSRDISQKNDHFYNENFFNNFKKNIENLKQFENIFVLGSNAANNYYSNLLQFLPRIFFTNSKKIKIAIHRNSSTKFREFLKKILNTKNIEFTFIYLDDGFYKFVNCQMPQFLTINDSVKVLKNFLLTDKLNVSDKKIYVTREDSFYRKIVNEADLIPILRSKGYKIINPQLYSINDQIRIFSQADKIVGAHGSNLSNIVFCNPGTEIFEIAPKLKNNNEKILQSRYEYLAGINNLSFFRYEADSVPIKNHSQLASKYISSLILENSNYYKNLIIKIKEIDKLL